MTSEQVFCHGVMKAYVWIYTNETLDDAHFGDVMCWGCTECGNSGMGEYGKRYKREEWKSFKVGPAKETQTEGYVLGNWGLSPYPDETAIWYLPWGKALPANFTDWDIAITTLRKLYRNLNEITDPSPVDPYQQRTINSIKEVQDLYRATTEANPDALPTGDFEKVLKVLRSHVQPKRKEVREMTPHAKRYLTALCKSVERNP